MSNTHALSSSQRPRVIFFGMQSNFSTPVLAALVESDVEVCAVMLPASPLASRDSPPLQLQAPPRAVRAVLPIMNVTPLPTLIQLAATHHIPVWEVKRVSHPDTIAQLREYQPDMLCVACFSQRIPPAVLALPRSGVLNVHPSLLPANRGPVPLFWTFREGHTETGVTIHLMDEDMDTGAILAQEEITVLDGMSHAQLEAICAQRGGGLLAQTIWDMYSGSVIARPQQAAESSYHSFPTDNDFVVDVETWDARHVYNFVRGIGYWDAPVELHTQGKQVCVRDVLAYSYEERDTGDHNERWVPCKVGWIQIAS